MAEEPTGGWSREEHLNEILAGYLEAVRAGRAPARQELLARHPELAAELEAFFADHDAVRQLARPSPGALSSALSGAAMNPEATGDYSPAAVQAARGAYAGGTAAYSPSPEVTATSTGNPPAGPPLGSRVRYIGDYELLGELGRGGMGVVYKARQKSLQRLVALKMILAGEHAGEQDVARFRAEAQAVARLQHPHIVQVYEVGEHDGHSYFSLEFCPGGSLAQKLDGTPLPSRQAAQLVQTLARTIQEAHQAGVVHRDLKPANVLLTAEGAPKISDFGLAKRLDGTAGQTASGAILGTPSYMAPEQAGGKSKEVGPACDVYALGAILYELLTGRPPFKAATPLDTVLQVISDEPVPPRLLQSAVPRDLETICLKCLAKEPSRRYASGSALAEDLGRWLAGEPILARPSTAWERVLKWARRRPAVAGLLAAVVLVAAAGFSGVLWQYRVAVRQAEIADQEKERANTKAEAEVLARQRAEDSERQTAAALAATRRSLWISRLSQSQSLYRAHNLALAQEILDECPEDLRVWEWRYLKRLYTGGDFTLYGHTLLIWSVSFSPDGQRLASASEDGTVKVWDLATGAELLTLTGHAQGVTAVAFASQGGLLASGGRFGEIKVWEAGTGRELRTLRGHTGGVRGLAFHPDGQHLASCGNDNTVKVWEVGSGRELLSCKGSSYPQCVCFSPDGKRLASGSTRLQQRSLMVGEVKVWDGATGREQLTLPQSSPVMSVAFSPDGQQLAVGTNFDLTGYDAATGKELYRHAGEGIWSVNSVAFSPNGSRLAAGLTSGVVAIWSPPATPTPTILSGHPYQVRQVAFSPDGRRLASAGNDGTVKIWSVLAPQQALTVPLDPRYRLSPRGPFRPPWGGVGGELLLGGDGQRLAVRAQGSVRVWDPRTGEQVYELRDVAAATFNPAGNRLATISTKGKVIIWDALRGRELRALGAPDQVAVSICYSPDGQRLAAIMRDGRLTIWDLPAGRAASTFHASAGALLDVGFSPDGKRLAGCDAGGTVTVRDARTGEGVGTFQLGAGGKAPFTWCQVRFSADGHRLAVRAWSIGPQGDQGRLGVWDTQQAKEIFRQEGSPLAGRNVAFDPEVRRLALIEGTEARTVRVWDIATRRPLFTVKGHSGWVQELAFSEDGQRLATVSGDLTFNSPPLQVKLWDVQTGVETLTLESLPQQYARVGFGPHGDYLAALGGTSLILWNARPCPKALRLQHAAGGLVQCLAFAPDGRHLASGDSDGSATLWNLATGQEVWSKGKLGQAVANVTFSSDGRRLGARYRDGSVLAWNLPDGDEADSAGLVFGADWRQQDQSRDGLRAAACAAWVNVWDSRLTAAEKAYRLALAGSANGRGNGKTPK